MRRRELFKLGAASALKGAEESPATRADAAAKLRVQAAAAQRGDPPEPETNGDEAEIPNYAGMFAKGLPHSQNGEVDATAYRSLLRALESGLHADFERMSGGSGRRLVNPQAAFAFHMEGGDSHRFRVPAPPSLRSPEAAREMKELYWQALCRDIPFSELSASELGLAAASDLGVEPRLLFRGPGTANETGPYVSQFLMKPIPVGSTLQDQRSRVPLPGLDFMTNFGEWLQIQAGAPPWRDYRWDDVPRYIRNGRDLGEWVHFDFLYQAFLNAALIIKDARPATLLSDRRIVAQPRNPYRHSRVQEGFVTHGFAEIFDWLGRVTTAALKAAWFQKWTLHRRLRPEAFGGRVHRTRSGTESYPIHSSLLESPVLEEVYARTGAYFLPQAYPEGAPLHPSYPGGHATVAGACTAVLKALFDEAALVPDCVHPSSDGLSLLPCPEGFAPTVGAELDKLAFNVAMGRNWAGIHYRWDAQQGIRLGEDVAISVLQDLVHCCTEDFDGFRFTRFDGAPVRIARASL